MNSSSNVVSSFGIGSGTGFGRGGSGTLGTSLAGVGATIMNSGGVVVPHVKLQNLRGGNQNT